MHMLFMVNRVSGHLGIRGVRCRNRFFLQTVDSHIMPGLYEAQRNNAIGRLVAGESQTAVARVFDVNQSTMYQ